MFFFESFLSLPNFCLWLLWSKKLEAGTFFLCEYRCIIAPDTRTILVYGQTHTHIQYNNSTEKSWDRSQNSFLCLSFDPCMDAYIQSGSPSPCCFLFTRKRSPRIPSFMQTGLIWPVFPFSQFLQELEAPQIHSHHQMTWEHNRENQYTPLFLIKMINF